MGHFWKNLFSFGLHDKCERAKDDEKKAIDEYQAVSKMHDECRRELKVILDELFEGKKEALLELAKIKDVVDSFNFKEDYDREGVDNGEDINKVKRIEESINVLQVGGAVSGGVGAGAVSAVTTWTLVGMFGTASTGTAIATLHGAAQTSTILAWLGGGSLAAGGGGMATGMVVLGGIVIVPAIAAVGACLCFFGKREIKKIENNTAKIISHVRTLKDNLEKFPRVKESVGKMILDVNERKKDFMEWHDIYRMTELQRKEMLIEKADLLAEIIQARVG